MSSGDRKKYLTATALTQAFLDESQDNLVNQLEMIVDIDTPGQTIYASDRNKYVGDRFYEALLVFPTVKRTIGEWLSPTLELSVVSLELNNSDGRFNDLLPGGANFAGWVQRSVTIKIGLRDVASTYRTIFKGRITEQGGFSRTVMSIKLVARDELEKINEIFPKNSLRLADFPDLEEGNIGRLKPVIYGDWTVSLNPDTGASIPAIPLNGVNAAVLAGTANLDLLISDTTNSFFDNATVTLVRSSEIFVFNAADIANIHVNNNRFEIKQGGSGGVTLINGAPFIYKSGDKIFVQVQGKALGGFDNNIVWIARDILLTYTSLVSGDFDANWATYRDKASPAESAISTFNARVYRNKDEKAFTFALSLLEQVRLEAFIDKDLKVKINSLHFEDFPVAPSHIVHNWDIEKGTFQPRIDERNNFNRAQGIYNFLPDINDNFNLTAFFRNSNSISVLSNGIVVGKGVVFPNLYDDTVVANQTKEILKLASSFFEIVECSITWRGLLLDLGDWVTLSVEIGSSQFVSVPCMVRNIGYDPDGIKLPVRLWSFQMTPYPGYTPGYANTVGGYNATIITE